MLFSLPGDRRWMKVPHGEGLVTHRT